MRDHLVELKSSSLLVRKKTKVHGDISVKKRRVAAIKLWLDTIALAFSTMTPIAFEAIRASG